MATQAEINAHDQLITGLGQELASGLESILSTALLALSGIDITDRVAVNSVFEDTRAFVNNQIQGLDALALDNLRLNGVAVTPEINSTVVDLKTASGATMTSAIDQEVNTIAGELISAGLLGLGVAQILASVVNRVPAIVERLRRAYDQTLIAFTSVLTARSGTRYTYTGGLIPTSRPFCTRHSGNTYSRDEIDAIWSGSWEGKAPGDPFVTRGGYNCRHFWILEE